MESNSKLFRAPPVLPLLPASVQHRKAVYGDKPSIAHSFSSPASEAPAELTSMSRCRSRTRQRLGASSGPWCRASQRLHSSSTRSLLSSLGRPLPSSWLQTCRCSNKLRCLDILGGCHRTVKVQNGACKRLARLKTLHAAAAGMMMHAMSTLQTCSSHAGRSVVWFWCACKCHACLSLAWLTQDLLRMGNSHKTASVSVCNRPDQG